MTRITISKFIYKGHNDGIFHFFLSSDGCNITDVISSGGIAPIYGVIVNDRTWKTKNIFDSPTINHGTILYVNQRPFSPDKSPR